MKMSKKIKKKKKGMHIKIFNYINYITVFHPFLRQ